MKHLTAVAEKELLELCERLIERGPEREELARKALHVAQLLEHQELDPYREKRFLALVEIMRSGTVKLSGPECAGMLEQLLDQHRGGKGTG